MRTVLRELGDWGRRVCVIWSAVGNMVDHISSGYSHPGITVDTQVLVPLIFVVDMYPVLPPILVGRDRYGAS